MTITKKFSLAWPEGVESVTRAQWVESLTADERASYDAAINRQSALSDATVAAGKLTFGIDDSMIWLTPEDLDEFTRKTDPVWVSFWVRYTYETSTILNIATE